MPDLAAVETTDCRPGFPARGQVVEIGYSIGIAAPRGTAVEEAIQQDTHLCAPARRVDKHLQPGVGIGDGIQSTIAPGVVLVKPLPS